MAERIKMPFLLGERGTQTSPSLQARKGILLYRTLNPPTSSVDPGFETVKNPTGSSCGVCG
jgi:hypothetical protein